MRTERGLERDSHFEGHCIKDKDEDVGAEDGVYDILLAYVTLKDTVLKTTMRRTGMRT